jgi:hypothetical protein
MLYFVNGFCVLEVYLIRLLYFYVLTQLTAFRLALSRRGGMSRSQGQAMESCPSRRIGVYDGCQQGAILIGYGFLHKGFLIDAQHRFVRTQGAGVLEQEVDSRAIAVCCE